MNVNFSIFTIIIENVLLGIYCSIKNMPISSIVIQKLKKIKLKHYDL